MWPGLDKMECAGAEFTGTGMIGVGLCTGSFGRCDGSACAEWAGAECSAWPEPLMMECVGAEWTAE
jgi:hypothetical protein